MRELIIIGSAACAGEDLEMISRLFGFDEKDFMAIGLDAVEKCPWKLLYVATYHPEDISEIKRRRANVGNTDYLLISHTNNEKGIPIEGVDIVEPYEPPTGSSSLLGVLAAIRMGYDKIILCGCPLLNEDNRNVDYVCFQEGWRKKYDRVKDKVRSCSGWTREMLGAPTQEWLRK